MWAACGINVFVNTSTDQCVLCTAYPIGNELSGKAPVGISHQYIYSYFLHLANIHDSLFEFQMFIFLFELKWTMNIQNLQIQNTAEGEVTVLSC